VLCLLTAQYQHLFFCFFSTMQQRVSEVHLPCLLQMWILDSKDLAGNGSQPPWSWSCWTALVCRHLNIGHQLKGVADSLPFCLYHIFHRNTKKLPLTTPFPLQFLVHCFVSPCCAQLMPHISPRTSNWLYLLWFISISLQVDSTLFYAFV